MTPRRGLWITFEGGDGVGKTTQITRLAKRYEQLGHSVLVTREPGGSEVGELIRNIVLHHRGNIAPRAEALLYAADRAHHVAEVVTPALLRGDVVIQDRYLDSSVAYQGAGRVLSPDEVRKISLWAVEDQMPDHTFLLDLDPVIARQRMANDDRPFDRLEQEQLGFHERVRAAFLELAQQDPDRFHVIDALGGESAIAAAIQGELGL